MRKVEAWGLAATLAMGLGAAVAGAAEDTADGGKAKVPSWGPTWQWKPFAAWFGAQEEKKTVEKKPAPKAEVKEAKKPAAPAKPASVVNAAAAERSREEAALLRRLRACDKLKEIAMRTNDNDLLGQAEELEERAQTAYAQRTAHLQGGAGSFESDEKTLDRYLGAGKARSEEAAAYNVSSKDRGSQAAVKEVKP